MSKRNPLRVVVWGPGGLGRICIRELSKRDDFEIVGVLAYNPESDGVDAGTLVGIPPIGVKATTNIDKVLAIESDCILHLARDTGVYESINDFVRMLEAGRNVVTVHPLHHIEHMDKTNAPADAEARLRAAAAKGGASFHATGIHPEFVCDRIAAMLSGLSIDIKSVKVDENWDVSFVSFHHLDLLGFGRTQEYARDESPAVGFTHNYCHQNLYGLADGLGVKLARTDFVHDYATAPVDIDLPNIFIKKGTVGRITHRYNGYVNADDKTPFLVIEVNWMMGRKEMLPQGVHPDNYYIVSIEGTPSLRIGLDIKPSLYGPPGKILADDPTSEPGYYATIATVLQAVPRTVAAAPGIVGVARPEVHWTPDFRNLARL